MVGKRTSEQFDKPINDLVDSLLRLKASSLYALVLSPRLGLVLEQLQNYPHSLTVEQLSYPEHQPLVNSLKGLRDLLNKHTDKFTTIEQTASFLLSDIITRAGEQTTSVKKVQVSSTAQPKKRILPTTPVHIPEIAPQLTIQEICNPKNTNVSPGLWAFRHTHKPLILLRNYFKQQLITHKTAEYAVQLHQLDHVLSSVWNQTFPDKEISPSMNEITPQFLNQKTAGEFFEQMEHFSQHIKTGNFAAFDQLEQSLMQMKKNSSQILNEYKNMVETKLTAPILDKDRAPNQGFNQALIEQTTRADFANYWSVLKTSLEPNFRSHLSEKLFENVTRTLPTPPTLPDLNPINPRQSRQLPTPPIKLTLTPEILEQLTHSPIWGYDHSDHLTTRLDFTNTLYEKLKTKSDLEKKFAADELSDLVYNPSFRNLSILTPKEKDFIKRQEEFALIEGKQDFDIVEHLDSLLSSPAKSHILEQIDKEKILCFKTILSMVEAADTAREPLVFSVEQQAFLKRQNQDEIKRITRKANSLGYLFNAEEIKTLSDLAGQAKIPSHLSIAPFSASIKSNKEIGDTSIDDGYSSRTPSPPASPNGSKIDLLSSRTSSPQPLGVEFSRFEHSPIWNPTQELGQLKSIAATILEKLCAEYNVNSNRDLINPDGDLLTVEDIQDTGILTQDEFDFLKKQEDLAQLKGNKFNINECLKGYRHTDLIQRVQEEKSACFGILINIIHDAQYHKKPIQFNQEEYEFLHRHEPRHIARVAEKAHQLGIPFAEADINALQILSQEANLRKERPAAHMSYTPKAFELSVLTDDKPRTALSDASCQRAQPSVGRSA